MSQTTTETAVNFATAGSTLAEEVQAVLQAALRQGKEATRAALCQLSGPFALHYHDALSGRSVLAVDRFAIRTLCYRIDGGKLQCAERADDLAESSGDLNPQALFDYLYFHCIPAPRTVFSNVHRLEAGHFLWWDGRSHSVESYWTPTFEPQPGDFSDLRAAFRQLLERAVSRTLDGTTPACFLSGGTDSSSVAGMICKVTGRPARTYSIGFNAAGYDEMAYARIAARHFGTDHREYYVTPDDLVRGIALVAQSYDQPFGNSSALPAYFCAKLARDEGVTHMLAGDGGDELFGGNSRYAKQRVFGAYSLLPASIRSAILEPLLERTPLGRIPGLSKARSYVEQARVSMPGRLQMYNLLLRLKVEQVLEPDFSALVDVNAPTKLQERVWSLANADNELDRTLSYDWRFTLAESDIPKVRGTATLANVTVGFPMLDDDLLAFSMRLPHHYKLRGLKLRWFFKEALRGFLPDQILTKRKQGFGLPFGVWATQHAGLMALATDSLDSLAERGIIRPAFIRTLLADQLLEHPGYYGEMVWILMMLEQWLRKAHCATGRIF